MLTNLNPKVVGFFIIIIAICVLGFWSGREYSEVSPPTVDVLHRHGTSTSIWMEE